MTTRSTGSSLIPVLLALLWFGVPPSLHGQSEIAGLERSLVAAASISKRGVAPLLVHRHRSNSTDHQACVYRIATVVLLDASGLALSTSAAAVDGSELEVVIGDRRLQARLLGVDWTSGLSAVRIESEAGELQPLLTTEAAALEPGRFVLLVGHSGSFLPQLALGLVGGIGECVVSGRLGSYLEFTPLGPPPEHGGAVIDLEGRLLAMFPGVPDASRPATAPGPRPCAGSGTCLAVPVRRAQEVANQLAEHGRVRRPWLGVTIEGPNLRLGALLGLVREASLRIARVESASPAAAADIRPADRILEFDGRPVSTLPDLVRRIEEAGVERPVRLRVERAGQVVTATVRVGERPSTPAPQVEWLGLRLASAGTDAATAGAIVRDVLDPALAKWLGLQVGDLLVSLNGRDVDDVGMFEGVEWLGSRDGKVVLEAVRDGQPLRIELSALDLRTDPHAVLLRLLQLEAGLRKLLSGPPPDKRGLSEP
jgi:serine protease Do